MRGRYYRLRSTSTEPGKMVSCDSVDRAVVAQVASDMHSDEFLERLLEASRQAGMLNDPMKPLRERIAKLEREKVKAAELALTVDDGGTFTKLITERSSQIAALRHELAAVEKDAAITEAVCFGTVVSMT